VIIDIGEHQELRKAKLVKCVDGWRLRSKSGAGDIGTEWFTCRRAAEQLAQRKYGATVVRANDRCRR